VRYSRKILLDIRPEGWREIGAIQRLVSCLTIHTHNLLIRYDRPTSRRAGGAAPGGARPFALLIGHIYRGIAALAGVAGAATSTTGAVTSRRTLSAARARARTGTGPRSSPRTCALCALA